MIVEIRPIEIKRWHGKTGKESFTQTKVVEALVNSKTNELETGLTLEEEKRYSAILNGIDLSSKTILNGKPHPFYGTKQGRLELPNKTIFLHTENPLDFLKYKLALVSKFVANSMKEYEEGLCPSATHVIFDEEQEITRKASKIQIKNSALKLALKMSVEEKANMVQILKNKNVKNQSQDYIDVVIDEILETQAADFIKYAKMDSTEVYTRALILDAVNKNILTKEGSAVYYMGDILGTDYEDTVKYFIDPQNQKMKISILEKINNK